MKIRIKYLIYYYYSQRRTHWNDLELCDSVDATCLRCDNGDDGDDDGVGDGND